MVANELLTAVGFAGVLAGVFASVLKGYSQPDQTAFSWRKLGGSLLLGFLTATGSLNIANYIAGLNTDLTTIGYIGIFIASAGLGYGIDQLHTASKN